MQLRQLPPPQLPVVVYTAAASIDATIAVALVAGRLEGDELRDSDPVVQPRFAVVVAAGDIRRNRSSTGKPFENLACSAPSKIWDQYFETFSL